uniref:Uncharacterized protein n=1 Tax=Triticum urartu TaxID=4572 RepID=A0A8R7QVC1_TRIUA
GARSGPGRGAAGHQEAVRCEQEDEQGEAGGAHHHLAQGRPAKPHRKEPAGEDQRTAPDTAGAGAQRHQGRHGHHAREGIQLRPVPAAASQGAGDGRVLAGARGNGAGDLPGEGGAGRHLVVAEGQLN